MRSKKLILALTYFVFFFCPILSNAEDNSNLQPQQFETIKLDLKTKNGNKRPKAPSMQQILCTYFDGELLIDFAIPEGECALTVTNLENGSVQFHTFSSEEEATIHVGTLTQARIEISTESGHEYEGCLE